MFATFVTFFNFGRLRCEPWRTVSYFTHARVFLDAIGRTRDEGKQEGNHERKRIGQRSLRCRLKRLRAKDGGRPFSRNDCRQNPGRKTAGSATISKWTRDLEGSLSKRPAEHKCGFSITRML